MVRPRGRGRYSRGRFSTTPNTPISALTTSRGSRSSPACRTSAIRGSGGRAFPASSALLELAPAVFLAASAAAGFGVTYLSGVPLGLEERVLFGSVLGAMATAAATFVPSLVVRDVTLPTVALGFAIAIALGAFGLVVGRTRLRADWREARGRWSMPVGASGHPWPLLAVMVVCGAWTIHFLHQAYVYTPAGLYAGYINVWGDWAVHLSFAGSFAYGHYFPPEYPIDAGHRMCYPFMIYLLAADVGRVGLSLTESITATSAMLGLAFPGVLYLAALRCSARRVVSARGVFVSSLSRVIACGLRLV